MFDRLVGLETEYAIRFRSDRPDSPSPSRLVLYESLVQALRKTMLTVKAKHAKEGVFTSNGGAVWFEVERLSRQAGLVEGATPECRSPRELLAYQRAQDRLLAQAASAARKDGEFCLIKNDRDSEDNVYGAQENYEAEIAHGAALWIWRLGLVLLSPLVILTWIGLLIVFVLVLGYILAAALVYLVVKSFLHNRDGLAHFLFGEGLADGEIASAPVPRWFEHVVLWMVHLVVGPLALSLLVLGRCTVFRRIRCELLPFLISRPIIGGAGMIDQLGHFHLSDKAPSRNCVTGYGGFLRDRPIFTFGHFFKAACDSSGRPPREFFRLFERRQRLQIALGDSNMCEAAEYLRVGSTMLVLDVIEAGEMPAFPRLRRPIRALHDFCRDPHLQTQAALRDGRKTTAIQLQRFYIDACRRFLEGRAETSSEAWNVLYLWEDTIDSLEAAPGTLVGVLDWVTKQFVLENAAEHLDHPTRRGELGRSGARRETSRDDSDWPDEGSPTGQSATQPQGESRSGVALKKKARRRVNEAEWAANKKIDIRYHELSPNGYYQKLKSAGAVESLLEEAEIERATRTPPADSPATTRAHYIREFSQGDLPLSVNWRYVYIGRGRRRRVIRISDYGQNQKRRSD